MKFKMIPDSFAAKVCLCVSIIALAGAAQAASIHDLEVLDLQIEYAAVRAEFEAVKNSNPALKLSFAKYQAEGTKILRDRALSLQAKQQLIQDLNRRQRADLDKLFVLAKIDMGEAKKKASAVFAKFSAKYKRKYRWSIDDGLGLYWTSQELPQTTPAEPSTPLTITKSPPFVEDDSAIFGNTDDVDLENGTIHVFADSIIIANNTQIAGIGQFFMQNPNFSRIKASTSVSSTDVSLMAEGFLGFSSASAVSAVSINRDGRAVCETKIDHGSVFAVVAWISQFSGGDPFSIDCAIRPPTSSDELIAAIKTTVSTTAVGPAATTASATLNVRNMKLKFFNRQ